MFVAVLLSPIGYDLVRWPDLPSLAEAPNGIEGAGAVVRIEGRDYRCSAPSDQELLFYDFLYSERRELTGMELRIMDDHVRNQFRMETAGMENVTWDIFPRLWFGTGRSGEPKANTAELFCDVFLCRADNQHWAVVVNVDAPDMQTIDLGVLRD